MSKGKELLDRLVLGKPQGKEWLELEEQILDYIKNEATEEEKAEFKKYTEMLYMTCRAIERIESSKN